MRGSRRGSIKDILPERVSDETAEVVEEVLERKLTSAAGLAVDLLHAMEERFGPEARRVAARMIENRGFEPRTETGAPVEDLRRFRDTLERSCAGTHRWERTVDEPGRVGYRFTHCLWAKVFNRLGEPDLGFYFCAGDEPAVRSFNPELRFSRTRVLMRGDSHCDHDFYVKDRVKD